jgi:hypothetical protein
MTSHILDDMAVSIPIEVDWTHLPEVEITVGEGVFKIQQPQGTEPPAFFDFQTTGNLTVKNLVECTRKLID